MCLSKKNRGCTCTPRTLSSAGPANFDFCLKFSKDPNMKLYQKTAQYLSYFFRWIEKWLRRWRNVFCGHAAQTGSSGVSTLTGICQTTVRDLRSAQCSSSSSSKRKSVLQSLKTDLECDAFNRSSNFGSQWWFIILPTTLTIFLQAFILWFISPWTKKLRPKGA